MNKYVSLLLRASFLALALLFVTVGARSYIYASCDQAVCITSVPTDTSTPAKSVRWSWTSNVDGSTFRYHVDKSATWLDPRGDFRDVTTATQISDRDHDDERDHRDFCNISDSGVFYIHVQEKSPEGDISDVVTSPLAIIDNQPPRISKHADIVAASQGDTTQVVYTMPTATDNCDGQSGCYPSGHVTVNCTPASGSYFNNGRTQVSCTATDTAGNVGRSHFKVTVNSTNNFTVNITFTNPQTDNIYQATDSHGADVEYTYSAVDSHSNPIDSRRVSCTPASSNSSDTSTFFPVGQTTIICSVYDGWPWHAKIFQDSPETVTVTDSTGPTIYLIGSSTINLNVGATYVEQGVNVVSIDGNLNNVVADTISGYPEVQITNNINTSVAGTYYVYYDAADSQEVSATQVQRTVVVSAVSGGGGAPSGGGGGGSSYVIYNGVSGGNNNSNNNGNPTGQKLSGNDIPFVFVVGGGSGTTGETIRQLQKFLNKHGFTVANSGTGSPGHESNVLGSHTIAALKKFQKSKGLPQTGILDTATINAINAILQTEASQTQLTTGSALDLLASIVNEINDVKANPNSANSQAIIQSILKELVQLAAALAAK